MDAMEGSQLQVSRTGLLSLCRYREDRLLQDVVGIGGVAPGRHLRQGLRIVDQGSLRQGHEQGLLRSSSGHMTMVDFPGSR